MPRRGPPQPAHPILRQAPVQRQIWSHGSGLRQRIRQHEAFLRAPYATVNLGISREFKVSPDLKPITARIHCRERVRHRLRDQGWIGNWSVRTTIRNAPRLLRGAVAKTVTARVHSMVHFATVSHKESAGKMQYGRRYGRLRIRQNSARWRHSRHTRLSLVTAVWLLPFSVAFAQEPTSPPAVGLAVLPRDLSPWGMFMNADVVVKAVMVGLVFASLVTWTVCLARASKSCRRSARRVRACARLARRHPSPTWTRLDNYAANFCAAAIAEIRLSAGAMDKDGMKERIASRLERLERRRSVARSSHGTGVLATIGAIAPFVGLFGTVWGIMNSFIGISKLHTTNLAIVAPGIAESSARRPPSACCGHPCGRYLQYVRAFDRGYRGAAWRHFCGGPASG